LSAPACAACRKARKISYELQNDQRSGKTSAVNLQAA
jgi:hypothetical protein